MISCTEHVGNRVLRFLEFHLQVWIDTSGHVGPYPLMWLVGVRVVAYVHYPTISNDMLARVSQREATYNNSRDIAASPTKSMIKVMYYRAFAWLYGAIGGFSSVVLVNSNWTRAHIERIWHLSNANFSVRKDLKVHTKKNSVTVVFPPCDVSVFASLQLKRAPARTCPCITVGNPDVVFCSVAQFRPEKNHSCVSGSPFL